jgi:hypothetical protein
MLLAIAGPYSAPTEEGRRRNLDALNQAAAEAFRRGYLPVIGVNAALPVAERLEPAARYEAIMAISLALVRECDALWLLAESPGANRERDLMLSLGRPVYRALEEIPAPA